MEVFTSQMVNSSSPRFFVHLVNNNPDKIFIMTTIAEEITTRKKEYVLNLSREELVDFLLGNWDKASLYLESSVKDCMISKADLLPTEELQRIALEL